MGLAEVLQHTSTAGWYSVAPLSRGCQKREGGRHLPNNGLTSFLAGERGAGGHVVISKRRRKQGKEFFSGAFSGNSVGIGGEQIDKAGAEKA